MVGMAVVAAYKPQEAAKHDFDAPPGQTTEYLLMNNESYAKLPEDARKALDSKAGASLAALLGSPPRKRTTWGCTG
jgi:TRAP-type C4-dicarboxylate transport system substrate-binding protein